MNWTTWVLFVGLLWIYPVCILAGGKIDTAQDLRRCLKNTTHFVIADNFSGFISTENQWNGTHNCILFLKNNTERPEKFGNIFPQMEESNGYRMLHVSKEYTQLAERLYVLEGKQCISTLFVHHESCENFNFSMPDSCRIKCVDKVRCQQSIYNETICKQSVLWVKGEYIIDIESDGCFTCNNPVKLPEDNIKLDSILPNEGGKLDASEAADVMNKMADLAASINGSSAAVTLGEEASGILVRQADPKDFYEISFGYGSQKDNIYIVENQDNLSKFSRSVTLPKEAFEKTASLNVSVPFVAVLRFINLASDEKNSNLLGNEVIAVEMGTAISNLTDKITLNYKMVDYDGMLSCHSWDGVGKQPKWTDDGCLTKKTGDTVMCKCSHLTFFAVLLAPPNQTLSTSDLNSLTIITQVGCGLSMFFLSIVLFMHALLRRTKASAATKILIQLVSAMFLLNLTFLINDFVAKLKNSVACRIVAVLMHYFMLTTFSWFAVQAFHLCLNLYTGGQIVIRHYILKVSITSWVLPSVVGIVLLILGKYGEQVISTNDSEYNVTMCWITDSNVHYIVNIGYYVLVFLFTFTTFIITVYWLFCLKRVGRATSSTGIGPKRKGIAIILGLCCLMGITWGFAFFAYGVLRIPSYYIFTVLNSLQGFFLFIYYYNTSQQEEILSSQGNSSGTLTVQSNVHSDNPYDNIKE